MHSHMLAELAVHLAVQSPALVANAARFSEAGLEQYWTASKCRFERWTIALNHYRQRSQVAGRNLQALLWRELRPTLDQILTCEVLTRVWTALCTERDRIDGARAAEPVARSVFIGHLEARNRVLHLLAQRSGIAPNQIHTLNRLRRRCENWVDLLLAWFPVSRETERLAFHPLRTAEFALELREEKGNTLFGSRGEITLASLRTSLAAEQAPVCPNLDLNSQIAAAIVGCFSGEFFDATGGFKSIWQTRLENVTSDTQGLVNELLCDTHAPFISSAHSARRF